MKVKLNIRLLLTQQTTTTEQFLFEDRTMPEISWPLGPILKLKVPRTMAEFDAMASQLDTAWD